MAGAATRSSLSPPFKRLIGAAFKSTSFTFFRPKLSAGAPFANSHRHGIQSTCSDEKPPFPVVSEGPSCILVGPIETASRETLEALYRQAREAYYNGNPLIVDDMFDRVELKLRLYGSKYVVKYPRCSLRRQSAYADAQDDPPQMFALASVWFLIFVFGGSVCLVPLLYTISLAYQEAAMLDSSQSTSMEILGMLNCVLFMLLGYVVGCPIASASARALQGLWKNDLVALKGACPSCGEEVFAFVNSENGNCSPHRANCHVCDCVLEFRTNAEANSTSFTVFHMIAAIYYSNNQLYANDAEVCDVQQFVPQLGRRWIHGRVYLISDRLISDRRGHRRQLLT